MAGEQKQCSGCGATTKYRCISCNIYVCNRPLCSVAETDEQIEGWIQNCSVSYCNDYFARKESIFLDRPRVEDYWDEEKQNEDNDEDEEDDEDEELFENGRNKKGKKKTGRRSLWNAEHIDDMVDIITNSENFKRKLIFTNNKKATNGEVYKKILKELKERHPSFPFTIQQMRNKFRWCVSMCKKVAPTIQTATGIKRFVEGKGFSEWFDILFPLIKSRDSCQPDQAIEPSPRRPSSSTTCSSTSSRTSSSSPADELENIEKEAEGATKNLFVPVRKTMKKNNDSETTAKILKVMETMVQNYPAKDLLTLMKEDAERSRQSEQELIRLLVTQNQQPPLHNVPQQTMRMGQFVPQQQYFQAPPQQYWGQPQPSSPQTTPERNTECQTPAFQEARKTYTKL